jgi:hypothetical protein
VNIEKTVANYLRDDSAVADLVGRRVVSEQPDDTDSPWVLLTQLDGPQAASDPADHLREAYLQLDCYAGLEGGQPEAVAIADAVRKAIIRIDKAEHDVVVTAGRINGDSRVPDEAFKPWRQRTILRGIDALAEEIKAIAEMIAPSGPTGDYHDSIRVFIDGDHVYVGTIDFAGHIVEWGSINSPAYGVLRRAVKQAGLELHELPKP